MIKVADFGLTEDMYATNYYRRGGGEGGEGGTGREEKVPIRWMAPESIEADFYDEKTDVVRADLPITQALLTLSILFAICCNSSGHLESLAGR